jgi:hypothetical protein
VVPGQYDEIEDVGEVARLYAKQIFPNIDGFRYQDLIYKSWTSAYTTADMLREDYDRVQDADTDGTVSSCLLGRPFVASSVFGALCFGSVVFCFSEADFEMIELCLVYTGASYCHFSHCILYPALGLLFN